MRPQLLNETALVERRDFVEQDVTAARLAGVNDIFSPAGLRLERRLLVRGWDRDIQMAVLKIAALFAIVKRRPGISRRLVP